jgi:hypothetical protein
MYDSKPSEAYCKQIGLHFSDIEFIEFSSRAWLHNLNQEQLDFAMIEHMHRVKYLFTPKNYSYINRIKLAIHFINPFSKGI